MATVVNNSERAITIIDVMLTPGVPTEVKDEYLDNPVVQVLMEYKTEHNVPILTIADAQIAGQEKLI
jgi:hypothetical protein